MIPSSLAAYLHATFFVVVVRFYYLLHFAFIQEILNSDFQHISVTFPTVTFENPLDHFRNFSKLNALYISDLW